jgi:hypothetical protein
MRFYNEKGFCLLEDSSALPLPRDFAKEPRGYVSGTPEEGVNNHSSIYSIESLKSSNSLTYIF